jgi:FecR protein
MDIIFRKASTKNGALQRAGLLTTSTRTIVMKKSLIPILTAVFILFSHGTSLAQNVSVGTLTLDKGIVKVRRALVDKIYRKVGEKIPVHNLDEIQTGKYSSVTIRLDAKGDKLELYSQSFFKIDNVTRESSQISMSIGKARFKIKKGRQPLKRRKKRFRVRTANAVVGVKGTEFIMATGVDVTNVLTVEGIVSMANISTPNIEVDVTANQVSRVSQNLSPTAPVKVPPSVQANILTTDSPAAFNNVKFGEAIPSPAPKAEPKKKNPSGKSEPAKATPQAAKQEGGSQTGTPKSTGISSPGAGSAALPGLASGDTTEAGSEPTGETPQGGDSVFDTEEAGAGQAGGDDAINLDSVETEATDGFDLDEPEIDEEDVFDPETILDDIEGETDELLDEIEEIQEEVLENQLQEIKIQITHQ